MPTPATGCPPPTLLSELLSETLPPEQTANLIGHVTLCPTCDAELNRLSGMLSAARPEEDPIDREAALSDLISRIGGTDWFSRQVPDPTLPEFVGPYRIDGLLGRGGMGVVYKAFDSQLGRPIALKLFHGGILHREPDSFLREAQAVARVRHDHVVIVHAFHLPPDGPPALIMELIEGDSLRGIRIAQTNLDPRSAAHYCAQAADGLAAAHAEGLIHRDVKPSNILVERSTGRAKLADFGLARIGGGDLSREGLLGTPAYMSPEQVQAPGRIDPRTDVYGLGATLYELLTGAEPFHGPIEQILRQVIDDEPVQPRRLNPSIPRDLETICLKAMAKDPAARYPSAADCRDDLIRWLEGKPIWARPIGPLGRGWRWC
ncbi:MAG TPA: serine/threonine-protein kinase, partial [Urbifossiella sp.]